MSLETESVKGRLQERDRDAPSDPVTPRDLWTAHRGVGSRNHLWILESVVAFRSTDGQNPHVFQAMKASRR